MEALYAKLYNRYTKLKLDELNREQEVNFLNYVAAVDEMIQYLKSENDRLQGQVDELKSELASIRSSNDEQHNQYEMLLMEEKQKNKELSEEIVRLQKLEPNECSLRNIHEEIDHGEKSSNENAPYDGRPSKSPRKSATRSSKKRKTMHTTQDRAYGDDELDGSALQDVYGAKGGGAPPSIQQPLCCQRKIGNSGGDADSSSVNCIFQYLVEFVVGMKVSPLGQSDELYILAHHQSSGYSFCLTWITNSQGKRNCFTGCCHWAHSQELRQSG